MVLFCVLFLLELRSLVVVARRRLVIDDNCFPELPILFMFLLLF